MEEVKTNLEMEAIQPIEEEVAMNAISVVKLVTGQANALKIASEAEVAMAMDAADLEAAIEKGQSVSTAMKPGTGLETAHRVVEGEEEVEALGTDMIY